MDLRPALSVTGIAAALGIAGCGGSTDDGLYSRGKAQADGSPGAGGAGPAGGGGWTSNGGRSEGDGGFGGSEPAETGGRSGGGRGGEGGEGPGGRGGGPGTGGKSGAGGSPLGCDFSGTWGVHIVSPVAWPATPLVLFKGTGNIQQWNLTQQRVEGTNVTVVTVPCGIFLPDLQSDFFGGFSKFGIRFPDSLFDAGDVPSTTFVARWKVTAQGPVFDTEPFATLIGLTIDNPTKAPWPDAATLKVEDHDVDGKPGITVVPATGAGYSFPPSDLGGGQADLIFIAERTVASLSGTLVSCDEVRASVTLVDVAGKPGINSTVIGCRKVAGTECTAADAAFIDNNRPVYTSNGLGMMNQVRLPPGATCKDVRQRFPRL